MERLRSAMRRDNDEGIAMILVIGIGSIIAILVVAAIGYSLTGYRNAKSDQDFNGALAAAYAGVEEFQSRLADDPTYLQYGNPASTYSIATGSSVALPLAAKANPAFGIGKDGTWSNVPGSGGNAKFRYEIDNSHYSVDGTIQIRSTGLAGGETRSIVADLKQEGFLDFLYFTDYEMQDPVVSGASPATCVKYSWAGRPTTGCAEISFGGNDVINGPAHTNDAMRVCNARFKGAVTTSYNPSTGKKYIAKDSGNTNCTGQVFDVLNSPAYSPVVGMPATNSQLKKETRNDLISVDVPRPGCLYTGPTSIVFNASGTVTVRSPYTVKTNITGDAAKSGSTPAQCGPVGRGAGQLGSDTGATFTVPDNNVIYVQNVPTVSSDVNYTATKDVPYNGFTCSGATSGSAGNGIGYPVANEYVASVPTSYGCRNGDVFVKGSVKGSVTVAAENFVYITDDLVDVDAQKDMIGLVGNGSVFVWNPVKANYALLGNITSYSSLTTGRDLEVDAAILSVAHSFMVQNYDRGSARGTLTVTGAIAQKFRGTVATTSGGTAVTGYSKDYQYDQRFRYTAPPKFLSPVTSTYGVNVWVEVSPVFSANGVYR